MIGAVLVEVAEKDVGHIEKTLDGVPVGRVTENRELRIDTGDRRVDMPMETLIAAWEKPFREVAR
jgi:hypothetical protein